MEIKEMPVTPANKVGNNKRIIRKRGMRRRRQKVSNVWPVADQKKLQMVGL
jgi:hypothetical protein